MAKTKSRPAPEPEPVPTAAAPLAYDITAWRGRPQYRCRSCAFDTLDEAAILDHVRQHEHVGEV